MIIRRPLTFLFLAYMLGIGSNYIFSPSNSVYIIGFFVLCTIMLIFILTKYSQKMIFVLILFIVFNAGGLICDKALNKEDALINHVGTSVDYYGTCIKYQYEKNDFHKLTVKNGSHKYLLHITGEGIEPEKVIGAYVAFNGNVTQPSQRRNPGCFDYRLYLKTINIRSIVTCHIDDVTFTAPKFSREPFAYLLNKLSAIKYGFLKDVKAHMDEDTYGLLTGMLFGSKDYMEEEIYEAFQKNGIAHILSVSGIHVGIVYTFIFMLLRKKISLLSAMVIVAFLFAYAAMAEFSPSVIRAAIMIMVHMISQLIHRPYDLLTGTCLTAFLMLLVNPLNLFHVGFQLSFLAVLLLAFLISFLKRYVGKKKFVGVYKERFKNEDRSLMEADTVKKKIVDKLLPLLILQLGMAPFSIFVFNHVSVIGLLLNIPVIAAAGFIIPIGICLIPLSILDSGVLTSQLLMWGCKLLDFILTMVVDINHVCFSLKFSWLQVISPPVFLLIVFYGLLFFLTSESFRIMKNRAMFNRMVSIIFIVVIVSIGISFTPSGKYDKSDMVFVDVGQGDCIHLRTPSGKNILIDGGGSTDYSVGKKTLLPYLLKNGISKLDYVFVTHLHTDHFQGIRELSNYMQIDKLVTYDGNKVRTGEITDGTGIDIEDIVYVGQLDRFNIDDNVYMDFLYPEKRPTEDYLYDLEFEEDENKNSLFMKLHYKGASVLITGDLDEEGEKLIMNDMDNPDSSLKSHILKVGHHGSKYSTSPEFLDAVDPVYAVIQVGAQNTYGHPSPSVIEKLGEKGIMIYRNDLEGAVMIDCNGSKLNFDTLITPTERQ